MSKRFWLPTQKGTGQGPTTQSPAKLVIEGIAPEDPLYRAIAHRFDGALKQFHGKCQQEYSLSINPIYKRRVQFGDAAWATYINQYGQEILHLHVRGSAIERIKEDISEVYDFALIELYVDDSMAQFTMAFAYLTTPLLRHIEADSALPFPGVAHEDSTTYDRMINAPSTLVDNHPIGERTGSAERVHSFWVDLRPARGLSAVTVELDANFVSSEFIPRAGLTWAAEIDSAATGIPPTQPPGPYGLPVTTASPPAGIQYTRPEPVFNTSSGRWEFSNGDVGITMDNRQRWTGYVLVDGDPVYLNSSLTDREDFLHNEAYGPAYGTYWSWHAWWVTSFGLYIPGRRVDTLPSEVQVTLFKSDPGVETVTVHTDYGMDYERWDFTQVAPSRYGHMTVARPTLTFGTTSGTLSDHFNLTNLGTVIIDQKKWSVSFAPA